MRVDILLLMLKFITVDKMTDLNFNDINIETLVKVASLSDYFDCEKSLDFCCLLIAKKMETNKFYE